MSRRSEDGGAPLQCDVIVKNGFVITMDADRRCFSSGAVAIAGRRIAAVGPEAEVLAACRADRTVDARGAVVHPGFIDPHVHIVHGTCRGIFTSTAASSSAPVSFADWKADVTPEDEHVATRLAALEMLRNGFTCFVEPGTVFDGDAVAEAAEAAGVRGMLAGPYLWDQVEIMKHLGGLESRSLYDRAPPDHDRCIAELGRELHRNRDDDVLVRGYVSVYGLGTASDALLQSGKALADENGVVFQQHENMISESSAADRERLGKGRIAHLAELGLLGANVTLIHMNLVDDDETRLLEESATSIVWCPVGYLRLGLMGKVACRMPELYRRGINVAAGVDGALEAAIGTAGPVAFLVAAGTRDPLTPEAILEMQTINAARSVGLQERVGSLEPGKRADIVIRSSVAPDLQPGINPVHQLALTGHSGNVDTVFVDGALVYRNERSTRLDEEKVFAEARASVEARMARLGLSSGLAWPVEDSAK